MKKINPKKIKIIQDLPPQTANADRIALDTEFFGMDKKRMHRPHGTFASLACTTDAKTVYIITDEKLIPAFIERIEKGVHIWHNAKFDIGQLRRYASYPERDRIWDTMLIEQEMFSGYYTNFSLKDLARRWLDLYMEKDTREAFEEATEMTKEMLQYAALDVVVTWQIYQMQREILDDLSIWKDIDRGALWTVLDMDGMVLDQEAWVKLAQGQRCSAEKIQANYPDINLRSPAQVLKQLRKKHRNLKGTGEKLLEKLNDDFAKDVLIYRKLAKSASTYGENILELIEPNGRIYSDFKINGAATGRFSSARLNLENIPKDIGHRSCFIAAPGHVLVDADWSSQEPRCAAYLSQDQKMIAIFKANKDIYIEAARMMFGWNLTKKDPRRAERMKPTVLGACYGLTEYGMEEQYNIPKEEGKELLDTFFNVFDGMARWIDEQQDGREYVQTIMGRKYWLNPYSNKSVRNAINSPVQGSAGDGLKIAAHRFNQQINKEFDRFTQYVYVVNLIHDEILVECDEEIKDRVMEILREVMISTAEEMHPGIPADVEIGWGMNWAEAHK